MFMSWFNYSDSRFLPERYGQEVCGGACNLTPCDRHTLVYHQDRRQLLLRVRLALRSYLFTRTSSFPHRRNSL